MQESLYQESVRVKKAVVMKWQWQWQWQNGSIPTLNVFFGKGSCRAITSAMIGYFSESGFSRHVPDDPNLIPIHVHT